MLHKNDNLNTEIDQSIKENGFALINIENETGDILCFTVGLSNRYSLPEFIFVNDSPQLASEIVTEVINYLGVGLTLDEILKMITISNKHLIQTKVPDGVKTMTSQIDEYNQYKGCPDANYDLVWVGLFDAKYPFNTFG